jgi:hypothetical protein
MLHQRQQNHIKEWIIKKEKEEEERLIMEIE